MELTIINEHGRQKHTVSWVEFNTPQGNLIVQPGHAPLILQLAKSAPLIFALTSGAQETITPKAAIAHITREKIVVIVRE